MKLEEIVKSHFLYKEEDDEFLIKDIRKWAKSLVPGEKGFGKMYNRTSNCDYNYVNGYNLCRDKMFKNIEEQ